MRLRWWGLAKAAAWVVLAASLARGALRWRGWPGYRAAFSAVSLTALIGIVPFLLVVNRPEQAELLGLTILCLGALFPPRWLAGRPWLFICVALAVAEYMFAEHAKAVFFFPLILGSIWLTRARRWQKAVGSLLLAGFAVSAMSFYHRTLDCPADSFIRERVRNTSLLAGSAVADDPATAAGQALRNLLNSEYLTVLGFAYPRYSNHWLPPHPKFPDDAPFRGLNLLIAIFYLALFLGALLGLATGAGLFLRRRLGRGDRRRWLMGAGLALGLAAQMATNTEKNFYEAALVVPGWILVFFLTAGFWPATRDRRQKAVAAGLILASIVCGLTEVGLFRRFAPFVPYWRKGGDIPFENYAFSAIGFQPYRRAMIDFFRRCGLEPGPDLRHVVIDDLTYSVFWDTREPYHVMYLSKYWGGGLPDLRRFLASRGSDGIAVRCRMFDEARDRGLLSIARKEGELCCVSKAQLNGP